VKENDSLQMLPIAEAIIVCLIVWIFELGPSLVALVTQCQDRVGGRTPPLGIPGLAERR